MQAMENAIRYTTTIKMQSWHTTLSHDLPKQRPSPSRLRTGTSIAVPGQNSKGLYMARLLQQWPGEELIESFECFRQVGRPLAGFSFTHAKSFKATSTAQISLHSFTIDKNCVTHHQ